MCPSDTWVNECMFVWLRDVCLYDYEMYVCMTKKCMFFWLMVNIIYSLVFSYYRLFIQTLIICTYLNNGIGDNELYLKLIIDFIIIILTKLLNI